MQVPTGPIEWLSNLFKKKLKQTMNTITMNLDLFGSNMSNLYIFSIFVPQWDLIEIHLIHYCYLLIRNHGFEIGDVQSIDCGSPHEATYSWDRISSRVCFQGFRIFVKRAPHTIQGILPYFDKTPLTVLARKFFIL